jgi:glucans biosynthesis protein
MSARARLLASWMMIGGVAAGLLAQPALAQSPAADALFEILSDTASARAAAPYVAPARDLPPVFQGLNYDGYRKLRPLPETTVWGEAGNPFGVLPLPRGHLYDKAVGIHLVSLDGEIETLGAAHHTDFVDYPSASDADHQALGVSGWRAITKPGVAGAGYEFAVFQGGTYFRAVGEGQVYGVSARALSIGTGSAAGEEFPHFTDFWIFEPRRADDSLDVIALADSETASAVYRFVLRPGSVATVDVVGEITPRVDFSEVGVAPLSSMYLHGPADMAAQIDQRPRVHDSDGLSIVSANGEHIWRPLANPDYVQLSAFAGTPVRFGLEQRDRVASNYADNEARYHRRPSIWIEPQGDWGEGEVRLLEIPTINEYADNVAAFWRPAQPWAAGEVHHIAYRLHWATTPDAGPARVVDTRVALAPESHDLHRIDIDFAGDTLLGAELLSDVWATEGQLSNIQLTRTGARAARLSFDLAPGAARSIELHAAVHDQTHQLTETWLFRWTPE